ncbi:MAG: DUF1653 domain-containing protein [Alphaproteobacteria bacterium]|nr:DUF1653 domain-containing protein [Alphaproteobacteria bacterium]
MEKLKIGGLYKHYKGNLYKVVGEARHSENLEDLVLYQDLSDPSKIWARPKAMFLEDIDMDGVIQPRFKLQS